jgi:DNA replication protein DnaC
MLVTCEKHNIQYESEENVSGITFYKQCPKCFEEFMQKQEAENRKSEEMKRINNFRKMNIEPEFYEATLDNFNANTPDLKKAVEAIKKLLSGEIQQIIMVGRNGTGKTHLAVAAVKKLHGAIYSMYEIITRIRATYMPHAEETELDVVDELARLPLLAIDELGRTGGSNSENNWLSYIIDKRHVRNLPTIIISNKHILKDCPVGGCRDCLENYISEDIMSRLIQRGLLLRFNGEDWRRRDAKQERKSEKGST